MLVVESHYSLVQPMFAYVPRFLDSVRRYAFTSTLQ